MDYVAKDFRRLLGLPGFSAKALNEHLTIYRGHVAQANRLRAALAELARKGRAAAPEAAELSRRFGREFNGMRLHELYFGGLARDAKPVGKGVAMIRDAYVGELTRLVRRDFGDMERWKSAFAALGGMRGAGWVLLCLDPASGRLLNVCVEQDDGGLLAGSVPLAVMDVHEHAYLADHGLSRPDYVRAWLGALDWRESARRLRQARGLESVR